MMTRPSSSSSGHPSYHLNLNLNQNHDLMNRLRPEIDVHHPQPHPQPQWFQSYLLKPIKNLFLTFLHILFHLIQFYLIRPNPISISSSTNPFNSSLPISSSSTTSPVIVSNSFLSSIINNLSHLHSLPHPNPHPYLTNNLSAILITHHSELNPFSIQLALNLASIGYHIFLQVSSQAQLTRVILKWQRLKSRKLIIKPFLHPTSTSTSSSSSTLPSFLNHLFNPDLHSHHPSQRIHASSSNSIGTIIPLLYLTHDVPQRLEAISTISAYVRQNSIDMISLINILDPYQIRISYPNPQSPISPSFPLPRSQLSSSPHNTPSISSRPLSGIISSPPASDHSNHYHFSPTPRVFPLTSSSNHGYYDPQPLPLSITSENYLFDAFADILLGPLSTVQDLLLLLNNHRGRVINIWNGPRNSQAGLTNVLLDGFRKTNQILQTELEKLQIPISLVYAPPEQSLASTVQKSSPTPIITSDLRSLLSESSDPELIDIFAEQARDEFRKERFNIQRTSDFMDSFDLVRMALESNYPSQVYPIGIEQVSNQISKLLGFDRALSRFRALFGS